MEKLPEDIILQFVYNMEIKELKQFCSQNKKIKRICASNSKNIIVHILKRKGYTKSIDFFSQQPKLLRAFYKIDPLLTINDLNIVKAFGFAVSVHETYIEVLVGFILFKINKS